MNTRSVSRGPNEVLERYRAANLLPLLDLIREPGRYAGRNGVNALTNAALDGTYNETEVTRELRRAVAAGQRNDPTFVAEFSHPGQGLAYGLNPYSDWALAQLKTRPTHYYLFLGLDWYAISGLGHTENWFDYLRNPFLDAGDRYWHNVWAWLLRRFKATSAGKLAWETPIKEENAADFIRQDGGAFIFHNRIPYLRPAGCESAGTNWYHAEWRKEQVRNDAIEDLRKLRQLTDSQIVAFCTSAESLTALADAGYARDRIVSWRAHPSRVFHPSRFEKEGFWFRGIAHFEPQVPAQAA